MKGISKKLKRLSRNADLANAGAVLRYINTKENPSTKNLLANAYDPYAKYYSIQWQKPIALWCARMP